MPIARNAACNCTGAAAVFEAGSVHLHETGRALGRDGRALARFTPCTWHPAPRLRPVRSYGIDVIAIVVFAILGRRNHDEGTAVTGILVVAWPFVAGWTIAWFATRLHRRPESAAGALRALAVAIPIALALRVATDRGIAPAFIVVACVFLGLVLVGRRWLVALVGGRRRARPSTG